MNDLVVRSRRVVLPAGVGPAAIVIRGGRIAAIGPDANPPAGSQTIDAGDLIVLPGLVDTHVHMNDPGRADWEGADHATRAAAAGGVTTLVDMPLNSIPATTTRAGLEAKRNAIRDRCYVDVGLWGGVVPGNTRELGPLAAAGVLGFKCFLSPSGVDEFEHVTLRDLREAMPELTRLGLPLLAHAELPEQLRTIEGDPRAYRTWLSSRPSAAETCAIEALIALAEEYRTRVHIVHLATADALPAVRAARARGVPLTVETCPHYLTFSAEDIRDGSTALKCAPPIRERQHREALWQGLVDGDLDFVATDHSPAPEVAKCLADGDCIRAWGGIASLQLGLSIVWTGAVERGIGIERVTEWMATAPARFAGLAGSKGSITPGADADLVIFDPDQERVVDPAALYHRHPVTPYAGMTLRGQVSTTILRGQIVFDRGEVLPRARGAMIGSSS